MTIQTSIDALLVRIQENAEGSSSEDLIYLAKALQAVAGPQNVVAAEAIDALLSTISELAPTATSEDAVYLGKALQAISAPSTVADIVATGDQQVARVSADIFTNELRNVTMSYDEFGRVERLTETLTDGREMETTFVYDAIDHILSATRMFEGFAWTETFAYDTDNNITSVAVTQETI